LQYETLLDIVPSTEMRTALEEIGVEVLGVRESDAFIGLVTDVTTGLTDGKILLKETRRITCETPLVVK
jgi:hypothetical protein